MPKRTRRDRGYEKRKKAGWADRHRNHTVPVFACPHCQPVQVVRK